MNVAVPGILAIAGVFGLFVGILARKPLRIGDKLEIPELSTWLRICSAAVGVALIGGATWLWLSSDQDTPNGSPPTPKPIPTVPSPIRSKYSFEDGTMGWIAQDHEDSRACVQVVRSDDTAQEGQYSLKMAMDLVGEDVHKSKGEAWVNMLNNPPSGERIPMDLTNRTVTAWVYAPQGSTGDSSKPNGFQLFVKDENSKSEYGPWNNIVEGQWVQISLTPSTSKPENGWMDQGFDPSRIIALGVKMGSGGGSTARYEDSVYIDAVDW